MTLPRPAWFSVRCLFEIQPANRTDGEPRTYEERVTLWQASSVDEAIARAETEAAEYADPDDRYLGLAQAFALFDEPGDGVEVYSLIRDSELEPTSYLDTFFDMGAEYQQTAVDAADGPESTSEPTDR